VRREQEVMQRLRSARGHLDAVIRMVEDQRYCIDVIHQIGAVQGALDHTKEIVLDGHLRTCVRDAYQRDEVDDVVKELVGTFAGRYVATNRHCRDHDPS